VVVLLAVVRLLLLVVWRLACVLLVSLARGVAAAACDVAGGCGCC